MLAVLLSHVVLHDPAESQQEIYNNYGPKPNSELILGYGFSLRHNPEDSVLLKVGGLDGQRWSVGRDGHGMQGLWNEIVQWIREEAEGDCEDQVEAADLLTEMAQMFLERMPQAGTQGILGVAQGMRGEVALMLQDYVSGQREVLLGVVEYARQKAHEAIAARELETE
ncbi:hypothetical protein AX14_010356 [Amanita brunnescens Koide BX004]|nr:hypothetical protein AX14_010356 [Amanita brunnescens Koide BX004]